MLKFENVHVSFGSKEVLKEISFEVKKGEIFFIIGRSGVGKSVLLKNIVGLIRPRSGKIYFEEKEISNLTEVEFFKVRKECGMIFQHAALFDSMNVLENILFGLKAHKISNRSEDPLEKIKKLLDLVHLPKDILNQYPPSLSFGMQKRVSIVRTLALEPKLLLFDEPTTGQDPVSTNAINALILELSKELQVTSIVVSHDMHCALDIADCVMMLEEGRVLTQSSPSDLKKSNVPLVREFLDEVEEAAYASVR